MQLITYRRDSDHVRIVFAFPDAEPEAAAKAACVAPKDFRPAAECQRQGRLEIPLDAEHWDRYGQQSTPEQIAGWSANFGRAITRMNTRES